MDRGSEAKHRSFDEAVLWNSIRGAIVDAAARGTEAEEMKQRGSVFVAERLIIRCRISLGGSLYTKGRETIAELTCRLLFLRWAAILHRAGRRTVKRQQTGVGVKAQPKEEQDKRDSE